VSLELRPINPRPRRGPPVHLDLRPQEALTAQVLDGRVRALAALEPDAQGGRPQGFAGSPLDRNVTLYRAA